MDNQANSEGICVAIRMRPMNEREVKDGQGKLFSCQVNQNSISQLTDNNRPVEGQTYFYDKVFDGDSTTVDVYNHTAKDIVKNVVQGINGTIFAYGQTSSGKTHTIIGGHGQQGILEMAATDIFDLMNKNPERVFLIRVSFVEIYNENIRDLLTDALDATVNIREDPRKGIYLEAKEVIITDYEQITKCLKKGISKRAVEATAMNDTSSRSHTIFKLFIESKALPREDGGFVDEAVRFSNLNLVDLAGSESVRHTGATGQRAKEGGKINQSLLSLSRVIHALSTPGAHVNFRDSKLTRILQPSLSGNAKMSIICCITPADRYLEETRSTLQFASRAKLVVTNATVNEFLDDAAKLKRLQKELNELKEKQTNVGLSAEEYQRIEVERAEKAALHQQLAQLMEVNEAQKVANECLKALVRNNNGTTTSSSTTDNINNFDVFDEPMLKRKKQRDTWCPGLLGNKKPVVLPDTTEMTHSFLKFNKPSNADSDRSSSSETLSDRRDSSDSDRTVIMSSDILENGSSDQNDVYISQMTQQLESANIIIQQLHQEIETLRNNSNDDNEKMDSNSTQNELIDEVESLKVERDALNEKLEIEMGANAEMEMQYQTQIEQLKQDLEKAQTTEEKSVIPVIETTVTVTVTEEDILNSEIYTSLKQEKDALEHEKLELMSQKEALNCLNEALMSGQEYAAKNDEDNTALAAAHEMIEQLRNDLLVSNQTTEKLENEKTMMQQTFDELNNNYTSLMSKYESLENEYNTIQTKCEELVLQSHSNSTPVPVDEAVTLVEIDNYIAEIDNYKVEIDTYKLDIQQYQNKITSLENQVNEFNNNNVTDTADTTNSVNIEEFTSIKLQLTESVKLSNDFSSKIDEMSVCKQGLDDLISGLQLENQELHTKVDQHEEIIAKYVEDITELTSNIQSLKEIDVESITNENCELKSKVTELEQIYEETSIQNNELKDNLSQLQVKYDTLQESVSMTSTPDVLDNTESQKQTEIITMMQDEIISLKATSSTLESKLHDSDTAYVALKSEYDQELLVQQDLKLAVSGKEEEINQLKNELTSLESKQSETSVLMNDMQNNVQQFLNLMTEAKAKEESLSSLLQTEQDEKSSLKEQLTLVERQFESATYELEANRQVISNLNVELQNVKNQFKQLESSQDDNTSVGTELEELKMSSTEMISTLRLEVSEISAKLSDTIQVLEDTQTKLSDTTQVLEDTQTKLSDTTQVLEDTQTKLSDTTQVLEDTQTKLSDTTQVLEDTQTKLSDTTQVLEDTQTKLSDTTQVLEDTQTKLSDTTQVLEDTQTKLSDTTQVLEDTQTKLSDTTQVLEDTQTKLSDTTQVLEDTQTKLSDTTQVLEDTQTKLSDTTQVLEDTQTNMESLLTTNNDLTNKIDELETNAKTYEETNANVYYCEKENVHTTKAEKDRLTIQQLTSELGIKENEISKLMSTTKELEEKLCLNEQLLSKMQGRENQVYGDDEMMKKKINQLQTNVDLLKGEKDVNIRKLSEMESQLNSLYNEAQTEKDSLIKQINILNTNYEKVQNDLIQSKNAASAVLALESKYNDTKAERDQALEDVEKFSNKVMELTEQLDLFTSKNSTTAHDNTASVTITEQEIMIQRLQTDNTNIECQLNEMQVRLKKSKDENSLIQSELSRYETLLQEKDTEMTQLVTERDELTQELEKSLQQVQELTDALIEMESVVTKQIESKEIEVNTTNNLTSPTKNDVMNSSGAENTVVADSSMSLEQVRSSTETATFVIDNEKTDELYQKLSEAELLVDNLQLTNNNLLSEIDRLQEDINVINSEKQLVEEKLSEKDKDMIETLQAKLILEIKVQNMESQLQVQHESATSSTEQKENLTTNDTSIINTTQSQNDTMVVSNNITDTLASVELEILKEEKDQLMTEKDQLLFEKDELESKYDQLLFELTENKDKVVYFQEIIARGQETVKQLTAEIHDLHDQLEQATVAATTAQSSTTNMTEHNEKYEILQEKINELNKLLLQKEDDLACVENELFSAKQQSEIDIQELNETKDQITTLTNDKQEYAQQVNKLKDDIRQLNQQVNEKENDYNTKALEYKDTLELKEKRIVHLEKHKLTKDHLEMINKLKDERKKYSDDNKVMKRQLTDLKKVYEQLRDSHNNDSSTNTSRTTRSSTAVSSSNNDQAIIAGLQSEITLMRGELEASQTITNSLKNKLKECSKQLLEYENERSGVIDVLESHNIDTAGLVYSNDKSTDSAEGGADASTSIASIAEQDLADAVLKLATKYMDAKTELSQVELKKTNFSSTAACKIKELEEKIDSLQEELNDSKAQRTALEKRLETSKGLAKTSRDETMQLTVQMESLHSQISNLQDELLISQTKVMELNVSLQSTHATAEHGSTAEVQALEEENLELLKENKELRKEVFVYKSQVDKLNKVTGVTNSISPRKFGTELGKRESFSTYNGNNENINTCNMVHPPSKVTKIDDVVKDVHQASEVLDSVTTTHNSNVTVTSVKSESSSVITNAATKKARSRRMSGPLGRVDENAPGECNQS